MSKQIEIEGSAPARAPASGPAVRRHLACYFAVCLVLCALLSSLLLSSSAQPAPQQTATATAAARSAALVAGTQEVLKETSTVRELSILRPVQSSTQSRDEIQRAIVKNLDEGTTPAEMHATEVTLKKLGLASEDFQYRELMLRLLTEQVAGYYEPKTQQFHLADWIDIDAQKPIMAHELTHALQDQHFNLRRFEKWPKGDSDAELAAHALIEGDATLTMVMYITSNPLRALSFLKSLGTMGIATQELDKAPRAVRESLLFSYQEGLNWTRALYRQDGWSSVSQAFTNLPQSTEQIIHPEKYFAREAPVKVTLPDLTSILNSKASVGRRSEPPAVAGGPNRSTASWKRIASDVNGEWGFYLILDQFLKSPAESRRAAAGWAGDRFDVYESARGEVFYVSLSAWDTEKDAREFFDALMKRVPLRYSGAERTTSNINGAAFRSPDGEVWIEIRGTRVIAIECPKTVNATRAARALWR